LVWGTEFRKSCFLLAVNKNPEKLSHGSEKLSQRDNSSKKNKRGENTCGGLSEQNINNNCIVHV